MLYDFKKPINANHSKTLCNFLDEQNYAQVIGVGFQVIRRDLTQEENAGNVSYRQDGVYLTINGQDYKGYIYLKFKRIYQGIFTPPKFHVKKCSTLETAILNGEFLGRYYWHNSNFVSIEEKPSGKIHKDINLELCGYCRSYNSPSSTQEFYNELGENEELNPKENIEVDIFGYVREWHQISQQYKNKKEFTCEKCNIQMIGIDKCYIHTDHKNGDKTRNVESNFECLCILCHCYKDEQHRQNFGKRRMKRQLKFFVEKYRIQLQNLKNLYLDSYEKDNA